MLPGALLASLLVMFPVHWLAMLIHAVGNYGDPFITIDDKGLLAAIPLKTLEGFGSAFCIPFAFIAAGAVIAPGYRRVTAISLAVLGVAILATCAMLIQARGYHFDDGWVHLTFTVLLVLSGISCSIYAAFHPENSA